MTYTHRAVFPDGSMAVQEIDAFPIGYIPEDALHDTDTLPLLSLAIGADNATVANAWFKSVLVNTLVQEIVGGCTSRTETVKPQDAELPDPSTAEQVTACDPIG